MRSDKVRAGVAIATLLAAALPVVPSLAVREIDPNCAADECECIRVARGDGGTRICPLEYLPDWIDPAVEVSA